MSMYVIRLNAALMSIAVVIEQTRRGFLSSYGSISIHSMSNILLSMLQNVPVKTVPYFASIPAGSIPYN